MPVWRYDIHGCTLEKRLVMPHLQNTVFISYHLVCKKGMVRLRLRPAMHFREHEAPVSLPMEKPYRITAYGDQYEVTGDGNIPALRFSLYGPDKGFVLNGGHFKTIFYRVEQSRGYECRGRAMVPGLPAHDPPPGADIYGGCFY